MAAPILQQHTTQQATRRQMTTVWLLVSRRQGQMLMGGHRMQMATTLPEAILIGQTVVTTIYRHMLQCG